MRKDTMRGGVGWRGLLAGAVLLAGAGCASRPEKTGAEMESLAVLSEPNLLLNGDFKQKPFFGGETPLFWIPDYFKNPMTDQKEVLDRYALTNGLLTIQAPGSITYLYADIGPVAADAFDLSFDASVPSGRLACTVKYRTRTRHGQAINLLREQVAASPEMTPHQHRILLPKDTTFGYLQVSFTAQGDGGESRLTNVVLKPRRPQDKPNAKNVRVGANSLRGIVLAKDHSFYELEAARYLRKYLHAGLGRHYEIFVGAEAIPTGQGMILVGSSFLNSDILKQVETGGYALVPDGGNLVVGGNPGNDDGAVHGVFALLGELGMEWFTLGDFTQPSTASVNLSEPRIDNPAFAYRELLQSGFIPYCPIGQSHPRLSGNNSGYDMGTWLGGSCHPTGMLLNPLFHFEAHPEYYALNPTLGRRTWEAVLKHHAVGTGFTQLCYSNPDVQRIVADNIANWLDVRPEMKNFAFCFGDRYGPSNWCACDACRDFAGNDTDRWLKFINIVTERVHQKHPDAEISFLTYAETWDPRRASVEPVPGVKVEYCMSFKEWSCKNHFKCKQNRMNGCEAHFANWIEDFKDARQAVGLYGPQMPGGILYPWAEKLREFKKLGIQDVLTYGRTWDWNDYLTDYVLSRLAWNPDQDVDVLIDRFLRFHHGPEVGKIMADYVKMVEKRDQARAEIFPHPVLVDDAFLADAERLLGQAAALTDDADKRAAIGNRLFRVRQLYIDSFNRGSGLTGERLEAFSRTLAGVLEHCVANNVKQLKFNTSYRKYLRQIALVDIGEHEPWHASPVVRAIIDKPVETVGRPVMAYQEVPEGVQFVTDKLPGGELLTDFRAKTARPFVKVLRRASSPNSEIQVPFALTAAPEKPATLVVEGLDDDKPERTASFAIRINGVFIAHHKPNRFKKDDWSTIRIAVKPGILKAGMNTLRIHNTTPERADEVYAEIAGAEGADYFWGWVAFSDIKLLLQE